MNILTEAQAFIKTAEQDVEVGAQKAITWLKSEAGKVATIMSPAVTQVVALVHTLSGDFEAGLEALLDAGEAGFAAGEPLILAGNVPGAEAAAAAAFLAKLGVEGRTALTNAEAAFMKAVVATKQLGLQAVATVESDVAAATNGAGAAPTTDPAT